MKRKGKYDQIEVSVVAMRRSQCQGLYLNSSGFVLRRCSTMFLIWLMNPPHWMTMYCAFASLETLYVSVRFCGAGGGREGSRGQAHTSRTVKAQR